MVNFTQMTVYFMLEMVEFHAHIPNVPTSDRNSINKLPCRLPLIALSLPSATSSNLQYNHRRYLRIAPEDQAPEDQAPEDHPLAPADQALAPADQALAPADQALAGVASVINRQPHAISRKHP